MRYLHRSIVLQASFCLWLGATPLRSLAITPFVGSAERNAGAGPASVAVQLDANAARALAATDAPVVVESVPLADGSRVDFEVSPLSIFTKDAQVFEFDGTTRRALALPDVKVFEGTAVNDPTRSLVLTVVNSETVWALVRSAQQVTTLIGPSRTATTTTDYEQIDAGSAVANLQDRKLCGGAVAAAGQAPSTTALSGVARAVSDDLLQVDLLVDVGNHLYSTEFAGNSSAAATYTTQLMGAVAAVYRRDLRVVPKLDTLVIWTTPEPFSSSDSGDQLSQYRQYSETNRAGQPRDLSHYIDSLASGGVAYLPGVCGAYGYGVSNIDADATFPIVGYEWDVNVIAHELGHNLGSNHTHCYDPPIDRCWNHEDGCYSGVAVPQVGETMSYCHLVSSIQIGFQGFIGNVIRSTVESASCVATKTAVCGDAILDAGEACDDGNLIDGDCCSSSCVLTGSENPSCEDGQYCTIDYACPNATCLSQPRNCNDSNLCTTDYCNEETNQCVYASREGAECDDGLFCTTNDTCQASACSGSPTCGDNNACTTDICDEGLQTCSNTTATPSGTCRQAGGSTLRIKNSLDDSKDSLQWKWLKGAATSHNDFLDPDQDTDYSLCVYDENSQLLLQADAPAAGICGTRACWRESAGRGFKYKDRSGAANGTTALSLSPGVEGSSKVTLKAKGIDLSGLNMPLLPGSSLQAQLRNDENSTCFESTFTLPFVRNAADQISAKE